MRPFDPRLLRRVPGLRWGLLALAGLGVAAALAVVAQAAALSAVLAAAAGADRPASDGAGAAGVALAGADGRLPWVAAGAFLAAVAARAGLLWAQGLVAVRTAAAAKAALRRDLLAAAQRRGPGWLAGQRAGELATLTGRGLDALDPYFTGYLTQLVLGVTIPVAVLVALCAADWRSALIVAVTLPLIPIFAVLVGWQTRAATQRQWRRLSSLGGHFLDMVAGLPTLRLYGRAQAQVAVVRRMADAHRVATMRTLRIAFLSALVLELVTTLSVALVAVPVGLRLLDGSISLRTALLVLLLAPEAYLPLRSAGAQFHASEEGLTALRQAQELLSAPGPVARANARIPDRCELRLDRVTVDHGRGAPALRGVSLAVAPGERVALVGPSGAGKSTVLALFLGFVTPASGRVLVGGADLSTLDIEEWRARLAWVPQRPHLFAASVADNIRLGAPGAGPEAVRAAARAAVLEQVVHALPDGFDTLLGERGHGLSSGQRQRVALARAFLRDAPVLLLDEPTARLDSGSEAAVLDATVKLAAGRTALIVAHRPALLPAADRVLTVHDGVVVPALAAVPA